MIGTVALVFLALAAVAARSAEPLLVVSAQPSYSGMWAMSQPPKWSGMIFQLHTVTAPGWTFQDWEKPESLLVATRITAEVKGAVIGEFKPQPQIDAAPGIGEVTDWRALVKLPGGEGVPPDWAGKSPKDWPRTLVRFAWKACRKEACGPERAIVVEDFGGKLPVTWIE